MSEMKWVPGFIWLTPRGHISQRGADGRNEWYYEVRSPMLVAVNQINDIRPHNHVSDRQDIANTCISVCGNTETFVDVVETVEEIAELIRLEWEGRTITTAIAAAQYGSGEYVMKESGK